MGGQQCKGTQKKERTKEDRYCCACCHSPLCGVWEVRGRGMGGSWERTPVPLPSEIHPCHTMQCCDQSIGHPFYVDHHYVSCPRHSMLYPSRHNRDNLPPNASHTLHLLSPHRKLCTCTSQATSNVPVPHTSATPAGILLFPSIFSGYTLLHRRAKTHHTIAFRRRGGRR